VKQKRQIFLIRHIIWFAKLHVIVSLRNAWNLCIWNCEIYNFLCTEC